MDDLIRFILVDYKHKALNISRALVIVGIANASGKLNPNINIKINTVLA